MRVYHGTDRGTAEALVVNPNLLDLSLGGGELGQGFYTGENVGLAMSRAKGRHGPNGRVLGITINDSEYATLSKMILTSDQVRSTWRQLKLSGETRSFRFGYDVVEGPFATIADAKQYKFESERSAVVLKQSQWDVNP